MQPNTTLYLASIIKNIFHHVSQLHVSTHFYEIIFSLRF